MVESLIKGVARFQRGYFRKRRDAFADLARNGQNPQTLFITCADSRIVPHAITDSDPGDLFVLRNVGNMVPPCAPGSDCVATGSAIEYAVAVLGVSEIIVCGHSHCGACAALFQEAGPKPDAELAQTRKWLEQGRPVRDLVLHKANADYDAAMPIFRSHAEREQMLRATEAAMVVQHLANLMTYPAVARRVADGTLSLHGWYYDIEKGLVQTYDRSRLAFVPLGHAPEIAPPRLDA